MKEAGSWGEVCGVGLGRVWCGRVYGGRRGMALYVEVWQLGKTGVEWEGARAWGRRITNK